MILKTISVQVNPGQRAAYLERQAIWNSAMAAMPGCLGVYVAAETSGSDAIEIVTIWQDRASLAAFMDGDHDRIEAETGIAETYTHCSVSVMDVVQTLPEA